jgi:hypothetical protein
MYVLRMVDGSYLKCRPDSLGWTVESVVWEEKEATLFNRRVHAREAFDEIGDYWSEQCHIETTADCPF